MEGHLAQIQWEHTPLLPTFLVCMAEPTLQSQFSKLGALQGSAGHIQARKKAELFSEAWRLLQTFN